MTGIKLPRRLTFRIQIRPLSPVHIGVGNSFLGRGAYHLYTGARDNDYCLALLKVRPLAERLLEHYGDQGNLAAIVHKVIEKDQYPQGIAHDIEGGKLALRRMAVHPGALVHLRDTEANGGLKELSALASGLPYLPGSSVKGALRTMWLDWQSQQEGAYGRFLQDVKKADLTRPTKADDGMMNRVQVAEAISGVRRNRRNSNAPNMDYFRAVQVSDLMPDRGENLTRVYAVQSMSYQRSNKIQRSNKNQANSQAWECLDPEAGAVYSGTVSVDLDLLARMTSDDRDATKLSKALGHLENWKAALVGFAKRFYALESYHYDNLANLLNEGINIYSDEDIGVNELLYNWVLALQDDQVAKSSILPLGMGGGLLSHSVLGVKPPGYKEIEGVAPIGMGHEEGDQNTLLKNVLDTHKHTRRPNAAYDNPDYPAPKSRRVTGTFGNGPLHKMTAERPLGWTQVNFKDD